MKKTVEPINIFWWMSKNPYLPQQCDLKFKEVNVFVFFLFDVLTFLVLLTSFPSKRLLRLIVISYSSVKY